MEMMGIEPMSEVSSFQSATIIVGILHFPPWAPADRVRTLVASSYFFYLRKALKKKFPTLLDALFTGVGTCGRTDCFN